MRLVVPHQQNLPVDVVDQDFHNELQYRTHLTQRLVIPGEQLAVKQLANYVQLVGSQQNYRVFYIKILSQDPEEKGTFLILEEVEVKIELQCGRGLGEHELNRLFVSNHLLVETLQEKP